jgi:DNA-binding response OmpR family regulator
MSQPLRVLVAEDEPLIRALVAIAFEAEGYDVDTAADGVEALAKARQQPPQAIVLDLMMPVMDGWDFLEAWHGHAASHTVPVIVISAGGRGAEQTPLDVQAFFTKPFDIDRLVATVTGLVEASGSLGDGRAWGSVQDRFVVAEALAGAPETPPSLE